ncbi:hypothetical protein HCG51_16670 [Tolypothrix sp. PCC 7910]|uniref:hypothetical protein n=1 Tax=Tolypothrix sp. PCC 7910 TaxID=2099387 RepID=UPI0014279E29|nr:hypothetical protein [Tolypothrix sp. PCC 7910]QIR38183.1 hypothetical protein HCG51_16670 [Tolypothrix sp. PCC 7910]
MEFYIAYLQNLVEGVEILELEKEVLKRLVDSYNSAKIEVIIQGKTYRLPTIRKIRIFQIENIEKFRKEKSNLWNQFFAPPEYYTSIKFISRFGREVTDELIQAPWSENRRKHIDSVKKQKNYINIKRLQELKSISNSSFDLSRLIQYCEEINTCFDNDCLLSVAMLVRGIIDHIPPIFGKSSFNEVANNYGSKSFKESMAHLNNSLRKIADSYLHTHIRNKEVIPNETQVDCSRDLDVLLGEIYRILK